MAQQQSMVEVTVSRLWFDSAASAYVLILRERGGQRILPIWIGRTEAESIVLQINQVQHQRPLTHDLCKALITGMGGTLLRVNITHVRENTYYAKLHVDGPGGQVEVDARPSDSIAVALRLSAPIFAAEALFPELGEDENKEPSLFSVPPRPTAELSPEELKAYLERLRPEDFGRFQP